MKMLRGVGFGLALLSLAGFGQHNGVDTLLDDQHYLRARPLVQAALQRNGNDVHALVQRSVIEWAFSRYDDAIAAAEKAVALDDKSAEAHVQLTNALGAKLASSTSGNFEKMGLARRFRKEADLSVQLDANSADALEASARFYREAPGIVGGDKGRAQQLADRLGQVDPARGAGLKASWLEAKDTAGQEALWRAAVAARPESYEAHVGLGAVCFAEGGAKLGAAESEDRRAVALRPGRAAAYRQLSVLYASTGRWEDLDKLLKQARAAVPDDLGPQYDAARLILTKNATAQWGYGEQMLRLYLAQPAEGEEPPHAAAHWRLGLLLEKEGRRGEAIQELQAALRDDPAFEPARKDLKRLS